MTSQMSHAIIGSVCLAMMLLLKAWHPILQKEIKTSISTQCVDWLFVH